MTKSIKNVDFIIVGQGLAGSILAMKIIKDGYSVGIIDKPMNGAASIVAAGIINPITGHRLNITDGMDTFLPSSLSFFSQLSKSANQDFMRQLPQYRLIKKQGQLDYWHKRKLQSSHQTYLGELQQDTTTSDQYAALFKSMKMGVAQIKQTYQVNVLSFLSYCRKQLLDTQNLLEEPFDHAALNIDTESVTYKNWQAKQIIFCEGYRAVENPWWKHLPFKLAKGELLNIESPELPDVMLNWGNWVLPNFSTKQTGQHLLGASYAWEDTNTDKNPEIAEGFLTAFSEKLNCPQPKLIEHKVGIRPTTLHRQPFIGSHPKADRIMSFNGFGSKGCLIIPHYADLLIDHLKNGAELPLDVTQHL